MKQAWILALLAVLASSTALAHGDHDTGSAQGAERQPSRWLKLVPRAAAAQRMEIDERQGLRFIRADGLPDHATGAFPNASNPNRITAQSYYFRMPLKPVKTGRADDYRPNHLFGVAVTPSTSAGSAISTNATAGTASRRSFRRVPTIMS